ncbi:cysteine--tRNA ligase [Paractinoplanes hotanensis]|uniref:Cysteine--tRNA ligase n=1 Tax=Paractinoplanes hotanensis TaxID=2906497 RepID=A0ABT0YBV5_9ACTN|nr:cysteine--tRNA ligase [Actinoplanes hotanensis]MCM4083527.1 cysteine--tRNA ligase [Actinoplanes hotanensis]
MTLKLHDTLAGTIRTFVPVTAGACRIYVCGATVQSAPHVGHMRSGVNFDVLRRWLVKSEYSVTLVRNVTDIDDKILAAAPAVGEAWWALAYANERAFAQAYDTLGCLPPTAAPRATGHVPDMIELMRELIDRGHAYAAGGDVYFAVSTFPEYGALSGQRLDDMQSANDADDKLKRDPRDFALWKRHKPDEGAAASWSTPWGPGRPGWHLECSAMVDRYLGAEFDIHGGGTELIFPHHENEIAQSRAAGRPFARYWVHNGLLNLDESKMSKSLGNVIGLPHILSLVRPIELRYYLAFPHYRSVIEYTEDALLEAAVAFRRVENFVLRAHEQGGLRERAERRLPPEFVAAMNDDLATPRAMAVLHDVVRVGNAALADGDATTAGAALSSVQAMLDVLGLDPHSTIWSRDASDGSRSESVIGSLVDLMLDERSRARERNDYAEADRIRQRLHAAGVAVEDTPAGPRWMLAPLEAGTSHSR